jgi:hypothetical protein
MAHTDGRLAKKCIVNISILCYNAHTPHAAQVAELRRFVLWKLNKKPSAVSQTTTIQRLHRANRARFGSKFDPFCAAFLIACCLILELHRPAAVRNTRILHVKVGPQL